MNPAQLINQDSGDTEYYTPIEIVEAARAVMGGIDLDPASSETANKQIKAARIFTVETNGLIQEWHGRIWLNHPFSREGNPLWINKLISEISFGHATEACCITYAATSEKWFKPLLMRPQCFLCPRTNYFLPDGTKKKGVTKGSVITYFGGNLNKFINEFQKFGVIKVCA